MADVITISASEATSAVKIIKDKGSKIQEQVNQLQKDIGKVKEWWKGDSAAAFVDEFDKTKREFDKMIGCINKYGDLLTKAIEIQRKADEDIARQIRS